MKQTVVGVFDRHAAALHAAQQLRESGFGDSVFVTDELESAEAATRRPDDDQGILAHVRSFFAELFGTERDDDREVGRYAEAVRRGGAVVRVEVDEDAEAESARRALEAAGAVDIDEKESEWRASGWREGSSLMADSPTSGSSSVLGTAGTGDTSGVAMSARRDEPTIPTAGFSSGNSLEGTASMSDTQYVPPDATAAARTGLEAGRDEVIPVVREELQVGKRLVGTGGVRVYARTVETPVHETVQLRSEHAEIERRDLDRPATASELETLGERTIEVRETSEQPVVAKEARVVEELRVGKSVETRTETIDDTVRRTEVEVEQLGAGGPSTLADDDSAAWRTHWQSSLSASGGRYEDYEPHYRWGRTMRDDPRYSGRSWDEIEPGLRGDWEQRHPGSGWERFKAAVRRGWDRLTPG